MLRNFLKESESIPWESMRFMTGDINYGGRVTDDLDRALLKCILDKYYTPDILEEGYRFSESGIYYAPHLDTLEQYKKFIDTLPSNDEPEVFGMHENANLAFKINESANILSIILDIQPRISGSGEGKSSDEQIMDLITELEELTPDLIDPQDCAKHLFKINHQGLMHCLSTVLLQEIERFNKLLKTMKNSLVSLSRAIQGLEIMSQELDNMYSAFLKNRCPPNWVAVAYPSLKPLASWIVDLKKRVEFMRTWCQEGQPDCFWLPGFFFPHGFMTGTLQTHARKHKIAIDLLKFKFKVLKITEPEEVRKGPEDGIYVNGLFIEGAKWNIEEGVLEDQEVLQSAPGALKMPIIHFLPSVSKNAAGVQPNAKAPNTGHALDANAQTNTNNEPTSATVNYGSNDDTYSCPVYKTALRAGVLNTTGQSTNFVLAIDLPTIHPPDFWRLRSTAMLF